MAARDNQGLQAVIIVLTLLVIGLGVWLLVANNAKKTAQAEAADARSSRDDAQRVQAELQQQANAYKQWMGFNESDSYASLQESFQEDMTRFGLNFDEGSRNYRTILDSIFEENRKLGLNEATAKDQVRQLNESLLALEAQKDAQIKQYEAQMQKAASDLAAERNKFEQQYASINEEKQQLLSQLQQIQQQSDEQVANLQSERTSMEQEVRKLETSITKLKEGLPDVDQFAQPADGRITWVNQGQRKVWINLGAADGLRPQVTFSVSTDTDIDPEKAEKKGSIEVVRVLSDHMSEARITSDEDTDPLLPGDKIYSQVWDRGRKVGFGIAGFIDMNKDGKSDMDQLKRIITSNNGRVDAAPDEDGKKEGELQIDTRFLVLGEYPSDPRLSGYLESWSQISEEADQLGVETIALDEFLKLMGYRQDARSVVMGSAGRAEDFPARPRDETLPRHTRQPRGAFQMRNPGVGY